jgi:predicted Zn-dependent peptidase
MLNSTFPADALERLRGRTLVNLTQAKDQPVVGAQVFNKILLRRCASVRPAHDGDSVKAITRDDVVAFAKAYYQPGRAIITVVGDITAQSQGRGRERSAAWAKAGEKPSFDYPKLPELQPAKIYLVDKPGARSQSLISDCLVHRATRPTISRCKC